ncbi:hypothetical protein FWF74_03000 [Candidatus Saccharibacteria bacterium]|nr:hypothetical protein [Candidatus Saccharibacteria bacterium]MCL1962938.1 hypothetical protein [Candidatus Saccharibacteria bacterium]
MSKEFSPQSCDEQHIRHFNEQQVRQSIIDAMTDSQQPEHLIEAARTAEIGLLNGRLAVGRIVSMTLENFLDENAKTGTKTGILHALEDNAGVITHRHVKDAGTSEAYVGINAGITPNHRGEVSVNINRVGSAHGIRGMHAGDTVGYFKVGTNDPNHDYYIPPRPPEKKTSA